MAELTQRKVVAATTVGSPAATAATEKPLTIEDLFPKTRLFRPIGVRHFLLWLWMPLGVVLMVMRLLWLALWSLCLFRIGMMFRSSAIENAFFRVFCWGIGVRIKLTGREHLTNHKGPLVIAPNHVSEMDGLASRCALGQSHFITPFHYSKDWFSKGLAPYLHAVFIDHIEREQLHKVIHDTIDHSPLPLVVFPEGCLTNGKGLLLYHRFLFSLGVDVLPVAIRLEHFFPINMDTLCTPTWHNMIWLFVQPSITWNIDILPVEALKQGVENGEQFAARVQKLTADHLGIPVTNCLKGEKYALVKANNHLLRRRYRIKRFITNLLHFKLQWE